MLHNIFQSVIFFIVSMITSLFSLINVSFSPEYFSINSMASLRSNPFSPDCLEIQHFSDLGPAYNSLKSLISLMGDCLVHRSTYPKRLLNSRLPYSNPTIFLDM